MYWIKTDFPKQIFTSGANLTFLTNPRLSRSCKASKTTLVLKPDVYFLSPFHFNKFIIFHLLTCCPVSRVYYKGTQLKYSFIYVINI